MHMGSEFDTKIEKVRQNTQELEVAMRTAFLGENVQLHTVIMNFRALLQRITQNKNELEKYSPAGLTQNLLKDSTLSSLQVYLNKVDLVLDRSDIDLRGKDLVTFDYGVYMRSKNN